MNQEEKRGKARDFVANQFTWASYTSLNLFSLNVQQMIHLVELGGVVLKKIEDGEIGLTATEEQLLRMKHLILLDSLAKLMMIIEGVIALCSVLADPCAGRKDIAHRMMWYHQDRIDAFIERSNRNKVSIWRVAGFPDLGKLQENCKLTKQERKLIWELFQDSCAAIKKALKEIIDFYQNNRIIYGKFKHGLSILPGFVLGSQVTDELPLTVSLALDHRSREPPSAYVKSAAKISQEYQWFNTISILPYWNATFEKYSAIMSDIRKLIVYASNNHLLYAENCGEDYFPLERQTDGSWIPMLYTTKSLTAEKQTMYESIVKKIVANTYFIANRLFDFRLNLEGDYLKQILECLRRDQVATIFQVGSSVQVQALPTA